MKHFPLAAHENQLIMHDTTKKLNAIFSFQK